MSIYNIIKKNILTFQVSRSPEKELDLNNVLTNQQVSVHNLLKIMRKRQRRPRRYSKHLLRSMKVDTRQNSCIHGRI